MTAHADLASRSEEFLVYRSTSKPSPATVKAYRQDFDAIAAVLAKKAGTTIDGLGCGVVDKDRMRAAFATYAQSHSAASGAAVHDADRTRRGQRTRMAGT